MQPQDAVDLMQNALRIALLISAPALIAGLAIGLIVGLLQALTQIQEQTIAFVPKLVGTLLVLTVALPWAMMQFIDYTRELFVGIPSSL